MFTRWGGIIVTGLFAVAFPASAATVHVDMTGVKSGKLIDAVGASFAQNFVGQTVKGKTLVDGSPDQGLLTLEASKKLKVEKFDPGVSPKDKSILPASNNKGPLSILLDSSASSLSFTMGHGNGGTARIDFFTSDGVLVTSILQDLTDKYAVYTYENIGIFAGLTIYDINDPAGLRFMNFSYEIAQDPGPEPGAVPLPGAVYLFASALIGLVAINRRRGRKPRVLPS